MPSAFVRPEAPTYTVESTFSTSPPSSVPGSSMRETVRPGIARTVRSTAVDLGPARLGAGARDHREVAEEHDGVLDEHRVGELGRGVDLERLPALGHERGAVVVPLLVGERLVDGHALHGACSSPSSRFDAGMRTSAMRRGAWRGA